MRQSMAGPLLRSARFARPPADPSRPRLRTRWRRAASRPAVLGPLAFALLATVAFAVVTDGDGGPAVPTRPAASSGGVPGPPRLGFTSEHVNLLVSVQYGAYDGDATRGSPPSDEVTAQVVGEPYLERLFSHDFNDVQPAGRTVGAGPELAWIGYRTDEVNDPQPYQSDGDVWYQRGTGDGWQLTADAFPDAEPDVSPRGDRVAYSSWRDGNWDIWLVNTEPYENLRQFRRLVTGPGDDRHPSWSPDGRQIVFSSTRDDRAGDLYVVDVETGAVRRLTSEGSADAEPSWSPDGNRIALTTDRFGRPARVAVMPAAGGPATALAPGRSPAWSPDGATIAYSDPAEDPLGDIYTVPSAGGTPVPHYAEPGRSETHPTYRTASQIVFSVAEWAPGSRYTEGRAGSDLVRPGREPNADIRAVNLDGTEPAEVVNHPNGRDPDGDAEVGRTRAALVLERNPSYAPDGQRLAYEQGVRPATVPSSVRAAAPGVVWGIGVADQDGRNIRTLKTPVPGEEYRDPAWSPDGRWIAVRRHVAVAATERFDGRIVLLDAQTGAEVSTLGCTPWASPIPPSIRERYRMEPVEQACYDMQPAWSPVRSPDGGFTLALSRAKHLLPDTTIGRIFTVAVGPTGVFGTPTQVSAPTPQRETREIRSDRAPTWSPDGRSIAYSEWVLRLPPPPPPPSSPPPSPSPPPPSTPPIVKSAPDTPSIRAEALAVEGPRVETFTALIRMDADGDDAQQLLTSRGDAELMDLDRPAWAPDGVSIAFSARFNAGPSFSVDSDVDGLLDLYAINVDTRAVRPVYVQPGDDTDPDFQPRADLIARLAADPPGLLQGQTGVVRLDLTNAGHHAATGVVATVTVAPGLTVTAIRFRKPSNVAEPVTGSCTLAPLRCRFERVPRGGTVPIEVDVTGAAAGVHEVTAQVGAEQVEPDRYDNSARTAVTVDTADIAVDVTATPVPAFVGGDQVLVRFRIDNEGTGSTGPVRFTATVPAGLPVRSVAVSATGGDVPDCPDPFAGCDLGRFTPTRVVTVDVRLGPDVAVVGVAVGTLVAPESTGDPTDDTDQARIEVRGPTVRVVPDAGQPGFVPIVIGQGFPPGAKVQLRWDRGVTSRSAPVQVDADGAFRVPMIVFHKDVRGPRILTASHAANQPAAGPRFAAVRAKPYLVTTPSDQPQDRRYRR